jgi:hypothetical protein
VVVDGDLTSFLHTNQLAEILGLPRRASSGSLEIGRDTVALLRSWLDWLRDVEWPAMTAATPSRGRTLRELTVNVFLPFDLLPGTWRTGRFDWRPEEDEQWSRRLRDARAVVRFAEAAEHRWNRFLCTTGDSLRRRDPLVSTPRGDMLYSELVAFQRWHAAFHHRQALEFLSSLGLPVGRTIDALSTMDVEKPGAA